MTSNTSIRRTCQALLIWALLPMVILAGVPTTGCVCPTGQFRPFKLGCKCGTANSTAASQCELNSEIEKAETGCSSCRIAVESCRRAQAQAKNQAPGNSVTLRYCSCKSVVQQQSAVEPEQSLKSSVQMLEAGSATLSEFHYEFERNLVVACDTQTHPPYRDFVIVFHRLLI